jgi:hypothetical protein
MVGSAAVEAVAPSRPAIRDLDEGLGCRRSRERCSSEERKVGVEAVAMSNADADADADAAAAVEGEGEDGKQSQDTVGRAQKTAGGRVLRTDLGRRQERKEG